MSDEQEKATARNYYVDEAGDCTLFDRRGRLIIGNKGCSRFFILGLLDIREPESLAADLVDLRASLLADPYLKRVPSMQPEARRTALAFHATDDVPEVRREVFHLLARHRLRFQAVVREKRQVAEYVQQRNWQDGSYHYNPNELYDWLVRRLFRNLLHKHDLYNIHFAKRGKSDRTEALQLALETARRRFAEQWGIVTEPVMNVLPCMPPRCPGLQAVDYFLWALQSLYEHREERYVQFLWPAFSLVQDVDDTRRTRYGVYYTQKRPLTLAAFDEMRWK